VGDCSKHIWEFARLDAVIAGGAAVAESNGKVPKKFSFNAPNGKLPKPINEPTLSLPSVEKRPAPHAAQFACSVSETLGR